MVIACRAYGLRAIDGPFGDFSDPEGYKDGARRAAALGCEGKWAIHPSRWRSPTRSSARRAEVTKARRIIEELKLAEAAGQGRRQPRRQDDRRGQREDGAQRAGRAEAIAREVGERATNFLTIAPQQRTIAFPRGKFMPEGWGRTDGHPRIPGQGNPRPLRRAGAAGGLAYSPEQAATARANWAATAWVVKAQIHSGGRGAGRRQALPRRARGRSFAATLFGKQLVTKQTDAAGKGVYRLWVEAASDIAREMYLGFVLDRKSERIMIVASAHGGMEIEDLAETDPDSLRRMTIDPAVGLSEFQARELAFALGLKGGQIARW
jgi:hypothetical protein